MTAATKHKMICYAPFGLEPDAIEVLLQDKLEPFFSIERMGEFKIGVLSYVLQAFADLGFVIN